MEAQQAQQARYKQATYKPARYKQAMYGLFTAITCPGMEVFPFLRNSARAQAVLRILLIATLAQVAAIGLEIYTRAHASATLESAELGGSDFAVLAIILAILYLSHATAAAVALSSTLAVANLTLVALESAGLIVKNNGEWDDDDDRENYEQKSFVGKWLAEA
jgi:multisubunit Na+/H+ antiporter MnhG subunit